MARFRLPLSLRLLQELLETLPKGRVFRSVEAVEAGGRLGLSPTHVHKLLSEMSGGDALLIRPRRGLYVMRPPFGGGDEVRPIAVAVRAVEPSAVSGQSALAHWGLLEQAPLKRETLSTAGHLGWAERGTHRTHSARWTWDGSTFQYRHVSDREMFGIRDVRLDGETVVPMFDRERTVLEELIGSPATGVGTLAEHRAELDLKRLHTYAERIGARAVASVERMLGRELMAI